MLWARPLVALSDGRVICGNMRLRAARELGWGAIPTLVVELDEARARVWVVRDNNAYGEWDVTLPEFLAGLAADGVELELTGFAPDELDRLLAELTRPAGDPDEAPSLPREAALEVWGAVRAWPAPALCGDSTDPEGVGRLFGGEQAGMVFTDPPYGVCYQQERANGSGCGRGRRRDGKIILNDELTGERLREFLRSAFDVALAHCAAGAAWYVTGPGGDRQVDFAVVLSELGLYREMLVWVKDSFVWVVRTTTGVTSRSSMAGSRARVATGRAVAPRTRSGRSRARDAPEHPTMKPVALIERALKNSSRRDDLVYDPFAGSGSTLIAADRTGRRCLTVELDPGYCDVIRQRYADHAG